MLTAIVFLSLVLIFTASVALATALPAEASPRFLPVQRTRAPTALGGRNSTIAAAPP
jgi:hypothetical protein